jgi:hypothetical protein
VAWETRQRGGRYYTRSRKQGGRVVREYVGCGAVAQAIARLESLDRERRARERAEDRVEGERLRAADRTLRAACRELELWTQVLLLAGGYHQHRRGEWRQRRGG